MGANQVREGARRVATPRLGDLYAAHADDAVRLAYLLCGDRGVAEDVVQEAFIRLGARLAHLRHREAFRSYLHRTVVNLVRMHFRKSETERRYLMRVAPRDGVLPAPPEPDRFKAALAALPYRQRAALVLRYYLDLHDEESAHILRCSRSTVRSLVARGLEQLRSQPEVIDARE